jgi:DNA helicase-2/ATP-dependent DNA helicase PcrA
MAVAVLNPPQREAVEAGSGPLLVLAGAGTGKTRVVTYRIARLIARGCQPDRILAVTFTNKAAAEMQSRVAELLGRKVKLRPHISTFHSLCVKILRRQIHYLGYPQRFAIYTRGDQESVARSVLRDIRVPNTLLRPGDLLYFIGNWKRLEVAPAQAASLARADREHLAAMGYRRYQAALKAAGAVDFDDLLLFTEQLFRQYAEVRREEAARFDHILVDEYQDTNATQYRIVKTLAAGHRNLCVVGDDDQSIYGWRGAEVKHILRFDKDWPDAKLVRLEDNYRSTEEILKLANQLIVFNKTRHDKQLRAGRRGGEKPRILQFPDEATEAKEIIADIARQLAKGHWQPRDISILFRTNEQPRPFETELRKAKLPYVLIGGMSFFDRKEVRDLMAYLRVLDSPADDVSMLRICNTPPRGIGQKTITSLMEQAVRQGKPLWHLLSHPDQLPPLPDSARQSIGHFVAIVQQFGRQLGNKPLAELATELIQRVQYQDELKRVYASEDERASRWAAVEEVINSLAAYEKGKRQPRLSDFLDDVALADRDFDDEKENQLRRNAIALMTLHSAKGLEFPLVYMVGMEEGTLPHHRSVAAEGEGIDEERRLCYVGITRAQERLTLSLALSRLKWGKPRPTDASRFLFEMTGQAEKAHAPSRPPRPRDARASGRP